MNYDSAGMARLIADMHAASITDMSTTPAPAGLVDRIFDALGMKEPAWDQVADYVYAVDEDGAA